MFEDKVIFITWWTWTWWQAIIKSFLETQKMKMIIVFSRSEDKQVEMERNFNDKRLKFLLWDIRNKELLKKYTFWVDYIIHLAALKHITKCEYNDEETIWINITWTQNIIDVAIENNIKKVLYVSTDKAVNPYSLYWNTKAISERIITAANNYHYNKSTVFFTLRAWNILWSNWSVIKLFHKQIINKKLLTVTDFNMRRFYVSIDEIASFINYTFSKSKWWEIYIVWWEVLSLKDIYNIMIELYWTWDEKVIKLWMKKWEKKYEELISKEELKNTYIIDKNLFVIDNLWKINNKLEKVKFDNYSTKNQKSQNIDKIKENIKKIF